VKAQTQMKQGVVIVAGGTGSRMGTDVPKQYLALDGKPVILHTLERFFTFDPGIRIVVVVAEGHQTFWEERIGAPPGWEDITLKTGGPTRYDSVKSGLSGMHQVDLIGIHDAVRPLVSQQTIERCYQSAARYGSGIPVIEMEETVRWMKEGGHSEHMDRSRLRRVQTPQVFRADLIREAYNRPFASSFTDDASVYESLHGEVHLVAGNPENIKITTSIDLMLASLLIRT
jgi:2-C-methyl-D-erythritol 4-phosphate cytidylyltransferase